MTDPLEGFLIPPPAQLVLTVYSRWIQDRLVGPHGHPTLSIIKQVLGVAVHICLVNRLVGGLGDIVNGFAGHQAEPGCSLLMRPTPDTGNGL